MRGEFCHISNSGCTLIPQIRLTTVPHGIGWIYKLEVINSCTSFHFSPMFFCNSRYLLSNRAMAKGFLNTVTHKIANKP